MLKEYGLVRVRETGMYGTIADWTEGNLSCLVELDGWQHGGQIDGDRQYPYQFAIHELEELVEVPTMQRRALFDEFDTMVFSSFRWNDDDCAPIVVIRRNDGEVEVNVQNYSYELNETRVVAGGDAAKLLSTIFAMHLDAWVEPPAPDCGALDDRDWSLDVHAGNRYFSCRGGSAVPNELVDLLYAVADIGLPLAWNDGELMLPRMDKGAQWTG